MQEEVTQRTVALCVEATRLSAGMLQQAMKKVLNEMQKGVTDHKTKLHHGKQTLRQLMVRDACGSVSTSSTLFPSLARPMPRFSQVVVFPVPPF